MTEYGPNPARDGLTAGLKFTPLAAAKASGSSTLDRTLDRVPPIPFRPKGVRNLLLSGC
jgi:hypothetical protein